MMFLEIKFGILIFCSIMMFAKFPPSIYMNLHVVKIENGPIIGEEKLNYFAFKGIPYAEAKRFSPSQPHSRRWSRVLSFDKFGSSCAQYDHYTYGFHGDEDCLNLNVFAPKSTLHSNKLFPVIIFIHGGAFMFGGSKFYGQDMMMRDQDIILVTINYRLGILGFLSTEDEVLPGNLGLKDQVEAFKWVQKNIKAFNGDPKNVTIAGFSAGGASVQLHYLSKLSNGLFNNGISHSGVALNPWVMQEDARNKAFKIGNELGCRFPPNEKSSSENLLKCLRKVSVDNLVMTAKIFQPFLYNPFSPFGVVAEYNYPNGFLTDHPQKILEEKKFKARPWIASITKDEGLYPAAEFYKNETINFLNENWDDLAPFLLDFNSTTYDKEKKMEWSRAIRRFYFGDERISISNFSTLTKLLSDRLFKCGFFNAVKLQAFSAKTYCYYFQYQRKESISNALRNSSDILGVSHGDDVFLIYNTRKIREYSDDERSIGQDLIDMYKSLTRGDSIFYGSKEIIVNNGTNIKCMDIKSSTDYSMDLIDNTSGEIDFWKSLDISE